MIERSEIMRAVKGRNTKPEMVVRRLVHKLGYRFRLYRRDLPGKPDLTFVGRRKVVFVHGCFWHGHNCRRGARMPATNTAYWLQKIDKNRNRDVAAQCTLAKAGWRVLVIWECEIKNSALDARLRSFLEPD